MLKCLVLWTVQFLLLREGGCLGEVALGTQPAIPFVWAKAGLLG